MMPECIPRALRRLALDVRTVRLTEPIQIGEFRATFFPADAKTIFWEQRVTQIHVESDLGSKPVFFAVDALIGPAYKAAINKRDIQKPNVVVCANNSQAAPSGAQEVYTNLLSLVPDDESRDGLRIIYGLLIEYLRVLPSCEHTVICGNGFVDSREPFGPFMFSDHAELARIVNLLRIGSWVHGPLPGWSLTLDEEEAVSESVSWVKVRTIACNRLRNRLRRYLSKPTIPKFAPTYRDQSASSQRSKQIQFVEECLPALARSILLSKMGRLAGATHEYLCGPLDNKRFVLRLHLGMGNEVRQYVLDFSRAAFVQDQTDEEEVLRRFPFGLELFLSDLNALLAGKLLVWDLASRSIRSWYLGDKSYSPIAFLYTVFGEQIRPDLAWAVYKKALVKLGR
jgi:hypothetical protein